MNELCNKINEIVAARMKNGTKEIVSSELSNEAYNIVKSLRIYTQQDVILFCAALNLLNSYVKQSNSKIGYGFKRYINHLFTALLNNNIPGIKVGMEIGKSKKGNEIAYVIVQIENLQFSFHQIQMTNVAYAVKRSNKLFEEIIFDGLRKQLCSVTIFDMVKSTLPSDIV